MTPDAFERLLRHAPCGEFVAAVNPLDEKARKALLGIVKSVRKSLEQDRNAPVRAEDYIKHLDKLRRRREKWLAANPYVEANVVLGMLACGSAADAHRVPLWSLHGEHGSLVTSVMIARNPRWIVSWVDKRLGGEFPDLSWQSVRELIDAGVIDKPDAEGYTTLFIHAMRGYDHENREAYVPTSERLLAEPELLEDELWRLFDSENDAFTADWHAKYRDAPDNYETWPQALVRLANDGHVDRGRLLDTTLAAMRRDIKQNQLAAYGRLHEALEPEIGEMKARETAYLDLLVSPKGPVVSFAVRMLVTLQRAGSLDPALFLDAVRPVFGHKAKGTAMNVLKLVAKLVEDDALAGRAVAVAIAGMAHPSADVQALALDVIGAGFAQADAASKRAFERQVDFLAAKLQPRAQEILGTSAHGTDEPADAAPDYAELERRIESLPEHLRRIVGLHAPFSGSLPPPLDFEPLELPRVALRTALPVVDTRDELLELAAKLIEMVDSAEQVEILLDGIARLGTDRGGDFAKLSAPLVQRIEKGQTSSYGLTAGWGGAAVAMIDLLLTWLTGKAYDSTKQQHYSETPREAFTIRRLREVQTMLLRNVGAPLLATPSYCGSGWVEPVELVERFRHYDTSGHELMAADLMQALLRLAPGRRGDALEAAAGLDDVAARMLRFALGGDDQPTKKDRKLAYLWLCAGRARQPGASLCEALAPIASDIPVMAGLLEPAAWRWSARVETREGHRLSRIEFDGGEAIEVDLGKGADRSWLQSLRAQLGGTAWHRWPLAAMNVRAKPFWLSLYETNAPWRIEWLGMQQPLAMESYFAAAARMLDLRSDEDTSRDSPVHAYLTALFDPTRRWGEMAVLAACLGLISRSADTRGFAVDALIPAIETGHADVSATGAAFAKLFEGDGYKINRFGPVMTQVLEVSALHRWWTARLVDEIVTRMSTPPKGAHYLYDVALDCLLPLQLRPSDAMAEVLARHKGSSKTARLARDLLELEGMPVDEPPASIAAAAIRGRLDFAEMFIDPAA